MHLPPEFCLLDGVPDSVRKGREMREAMQTIRITPEEKIAKISKLRKELFAQKAIKDWGIMIEELPIELPRSCVLGAPAILQGNQVIHIDEAMMRNLAIATPKDLLQDQWIIMYKRQNFDLAEAVYDNLEKSSKRLKVNVQEPHWIELDREDDRVEMEHKLMEYMVKGNKFTHPTVVVLVLGYEEHYKMFK